MFWVVFSLSTDALFRLLKLDFVENTSKILTARDMNKPEKKTSVDGLGSFSFPCSFWLDKEL